MANVKISDLTDGSPIVSGDLIEIERPGSPSVSRKAELGSAAGADIEDFATAAQGALADTAVQPSDLATVATTGDYDDLTNKPDLGDAAFLDVGTGAGDVAAGNHTHSNATTSVAGFMSASDKAKLDGIAAGAEVNAVTSVAGRTGAVTLAQADISGLTTSDSPQFAGINLGHASDTTLSRSAAGRLAVEGVDVLLAGAEDQTITGGARVTSLSLGTITSGTVTPDPGDRPMQHYTNGGAHTFAPGSNPGTYVLDIVNNSSAGAITVSGWTKVAGDPFTTNDGDAFRCHCSVGNAGSLIVVQAMQ